MSIHYPPKQIAKRIQPISHGLNQGTVRRHHPDTPSVELPVGTFDTEKGIVPEVGALADL
jgi:hypothetical protein